MIKRTGLGITEDSSLQSLMPQMRISGSFSLDADPVCDLLFGNVTVIDLYNFSVLYYCYRYNQDNILMESL